MAASSEHKAASQAPAKEVGNAGHTDASPAAEAATQTTAPQPPASQSPTESAARPATVSPLSPPVAAYIALGSNMGDREAHLMRAIGELNNQPGIEVTAVSGIYETDPVGYTDQPAFLNMAVAVKTELAPLELLRTQLRLESALGRIRQERWGPRTIDLDLLLYDNVRMDQEELTLPHPRMMERAFVLVPLHDVISSSHPLHEQVSTTTARALQAGKDGITLWKTINWRSASEPSGS
ncbi:2-amino-4-hydroxy-6-hydroxymethyldihydropteridine diphosphokinase [Paenibacillus sp. MY03]|uniref:2-amino-4-hydroxy-6- hydroxymethyldihydropteridine diphosphokinase n=1 Tax=Paenibacillus sp. MY03 TaxID=302980 RepID=UPI000B3BF034|nr:2-amino-4-hydroxy-6-hydroxymethyldihydropteridine diphosphokinase [Paenibacillus sp. MY03]